METSENPVKSLVFSSALKVNHLNIIRSTLQGITSVNVTIIDIQICNNKLSYFQAWVAGVWVVLNVRQGTAGMSTTSWSPSNKLSLCSQTIRIIIIAVTLSTCYYQKITRVLCHIFIKQTDIPSIMTKITPYQSSVISLKNCCPFVWTKKNFTSNVLYFNLLNLHGYSNYILLFLSIKTFKYKWLLQPKHNVMCVTCMFIRTPSPHSWG